MKHVDQLERGSLGHELQGAVSDLMYQVGIALYDAGRLAQSERAGAIALDLAHQAEDPPARARAYDALSRVSLYRGDPLRAVRHAQRGLRVPDLPPSRLSSLHMRLGRALACVNGGPIS
ncbi:tetratricopeptide repeat protein [Nonomuraea sp. NPDC047529]|uniref:tetratricopeptide repeat protein n=1 Tax=Nonomuraea sp. NPDC047529 TaxID=3155623 RepID=UPI0033DEC87C